MAPPDPALAPDPHPGKVTSGCAALLGKISGHHCRMACSRWCTAGPRPARRSPGVPMCRGARPTGGPSSSARHDDFLAGLAAAVSGLALDDRRSRAYWPHSSSTSLRGRSPRGPVAVGDGRTGVPHPENPRSPDTATPPRRRAGESLNLLSRDRTADGHASIYCGNASCGRERAQIMVFCSLVIVNVAAAMGRRLRWTLLRRWTTPTWLGWIRCQARIAYSTTPTGNLPGCCTRLP